MSCPQKDIHSVYIDGELPETYRAEYEAHVASCARCQAELAKLRRLHELLAGVSAPALTPARATDAAFTEQSFARLQTKLRYRRNVNAAERTHALPFALTRWAIPAAAAAAVAAVVFVPLHTRASDSASASEAVTVIASAELKPLAEKSVVIDGNISHTELAQLAVAEPPAPASQANAADATAEAAAAQNGAHGAGRPESTLEPTAKAALAAADGGASDASGAAKSQSAALAANVDVGVPLAPVGTASPRPLMEQRTVRAQTVSNGMRRSLQSVDVFRPSNINAPAAVSRVISIDGNISHESLSSLAVTDTQDAAR